MQERSDEGVADVTTPSSPKGANKVKFKFIF